MTYTDDLKVIMMKRVKNQFKDIIKFQQKRRIEVVKDIKRLRKPFMYNKHIDEFNKKYKNEVDVDSLIARQEELREIHIAYCEFFNGTPRDLIETPRKYNQASKTVINRLKNDWELIVQAKYIEATKNEKEVA